MIRYDLMRHLRHVKTLYRYLCSGLWPTILILFHVAAAPLHAAGEQLPEIQALEHAHHDFMPVSEDLSPLKTRIVSISARSTPLRDVLHVIAEATGLNLVMEKGVDPDIPVTLTLRNVTALDAMNTVISAVDYFYSVSDNMLFVRALDTKIFEFGMPSVVQDYSVDVGGDILGGSSAGTTGGSSSIKGGITQRKQADKESFRLWESIEKTIGSLIGLSGSGATQSSQGAAFKTQSQNQAGLSINRMTGTIVVTAAKKDIEKTERYLDGIKMVLNRQVFIEARIAEVQLSEGLKYGIDWTALDMSKFGQVTVGPTKFSEVISETMPSFQIGISRWDFTGLLKALQSQGEVRVLSNPRVNIMNGQTALLSVGRNVNFISRVETTTVPAASSTSTATTTFTVQTGSVLSGIIIGIVPHINEKGDVSMSITPIVSELVKLEDKTVGKVGENTIQISLPTIDLRELSTMVTIKDGQMVVIGGLIQNREKLLDNQVPFFGNIPVIGHLFKSRDKVNEKTELVVMLKPVVITH
ncbi:MAG: hypothetical protein HZA17_13430 [Nitrospirae bacterium]|nr:hypothetical protein [Nitrospirota bacterium]